MKTFKNPILTKPEAEQALDTAIALVRRNLPLYTDHCQNHSSVHDIYPQCENNQWTCGFWPGEVWLSYERTGDEAFKNTALTWWTASSTALSTRSRSTTTTWASCTARPVSPPTS